MRLYITRHGETKWNLEGRMQGSGNSDLTEKGIADAIKLGEYLNDVEFNRIYSSPLGRAVETSKCIKNNRDIEIIYLDELKEMSFGVWEGMDKDLVIENYPEQYNNFWYNTEAYEPVENGESFDELFNRIQNSLDYICKNEKEGNVLVVAHAVVIKAILSIIKNNSLDKFWNPPFLHGTALTIIEVEDNKFDIIKEADMSHINS